MADPRVRQELKGVVREAGIRMADSGLTISTWGNISVCDREAGLFYVTPSGMDYHALVDDDIVVLDLDGTVVEGTRRPSIERELHRLVYRARPDVAAVVHTHPMFSTVFGCMGEGLPLNIHDEAAQALGDTVRVCDYALPGTTELAEQVVRTLGERAKACLMRSHGAVCVGTDINDAFKVATALEMVAELAWRIRACGGSYLPISDENVAAMQEFARTGYGQL